MPRYESAHGAAAIGKAHSEASPWGKDAG